MYLSTKQKVNEMTTLYEKRKLKSQKLFEAKMNKTEGNKPASLKTKVGFVEGFFNNKGVSIEGQRALKIAKTELKGISGLMFICNALYNSGVEYSKEKALKKVFYAKDVDKYFNFLITAMDNKAHLRNHGLEEELLEVHRRKAANRGFNKMKKEADKIIKNSNVEEDEISEGMKKVFEYLDRFDSLLA